MATLLIKYFPEILKKKNVKMSKRSSSYHLDYGDNKRKKHKGLSSDSDSDQDLDDRNISEPSESSNMTIFPSERVRVLNHQRQISTDMDFNNDELVDNQQAGPSSVACPYCKARFADKHLLEVHKKEVHPDTISQICKFCGYSATEMNGRTFHSIY